MEIKLIWLKIKNFKGIKNFTFVLNGKNTSVYANNGVGKTTLMDSFLWLLFDKDSTDRTTFKLKPQDESGQDIHNLQTEVEAELSIDGQPLLIKKMQEEKWTKKRGSEQAELTGNTVSYWWNEMPVKAGEFKDKVSELVSEDIFKLITNPLYFNTKLDWQKRREILLVMSGDMTDEQVIEADNSLCKLKEILNGRNIEDYKKILADKLKGFKKEHDDIPPRIDELTSSLPQENIDYLAIEKQLDELKGTLDGIEILLTSKQQQANEVAKKWGELGQLNNQLDVLKRKLNDEANKDKILLLQEKQELETGRMVLHNSINLLKKDIENVNNQLEINVKKREELLTEWQELKKSAAEYQSLVFIEPDENNFICPTCKQDLPVEEKKGRIANLRSNFEKYRADSIDKCNKDLENNKNYGLKLKEDTEKLNKILEDNNDEIIAKEKSLTELKIKIQNLQVIIDLPTIEVEYTQYPEYVELIAKIEKLQAELDKQAEDTPNVLLSQKTNLQQQIDECNAILNSKAETEKKKARIEELKAEENRIATNIAELEGHKYLLEKFTISKVNLLEDKINSNFKFVKFRLFNVQQNGGIVECCTAMVNTNGSYVDFIDANAAGKTNAGIDIINALNKFYGVQAPLWIDNREGTSELADTQNQVINLIKPHTWKELDGVAREALEKTSITQSAWDKKYDTLLVEREEI